MSKTLELYKDGVFIGERVKDEIERLGAENKPFGYELVIFEELGIAILEKDRKKIKLAKERMDTFKKTIDKIKDGGKIPQHELENVRTMIMNLTTSRFK